MADDKLGSYYQSTVLIHEDEIRRLYKSLDQPSTQPVPDPVVPINNSRNAKLLRVASREIGVKEWRQGSNPIIDRYFDETEADGDSTHTDDIPWCAAYVGAMLRRAGMGWIKDNFLARKYESWGRDSSKDPLPGDLWIMSRGSNGWSGHIGVLIELQSSRALVMGGNQSDECNLTWYSRSRETAIRRSSKQFDLTRAQRDLLFKLAADIKAGRDISEGGSVV